MIFGLGVFLTAVGAVVRYCFAPLRMLLKKAWAKMARVLSKVGQDFGKIFLIHRQKMSKIFLK